MDRERPRSSASCDAMPGGSWQWSPTKTRRFSALPPRSTMGTMAESSVACATSSMRRPAKCSFERKSPPALIVVVQMTSASRRIRICSSKSWRRPRRLSSCSASRSMAALGPRPRGTAAALARATAAAWLPRPSAVAAGASLPLPPELAPPASARGPRSALSARSSSSRCFTCCSCASSVSSSRKPRTFSGRPRRTARTPRAWSPAAMLSTATLLSEAASSGPMPKDLAQSRSTCTETWVLPVPGGPWMMVQVRAMAAATASRCERFNPMRPWTSALARSRLALSRPLGASAASCSARVGPWLSLRGPGLGERGRPPAAAPALRRLSAQASRPPTPAATSSSLHGGRWLAAASCRSAVNCRS
mmetsp:Transcript_46554/g.144228  ORF Transcript_46554/g.144228 Transcript_46554/m.144228 type:complete len:362 (+) Transcript_46554:762-1847(+)